MKHSHFLSMLPEECQTIEIEPRHKIALRPFFLKHAIWIVLLTEQHEQSDKAWVLTWEQWKSIEPKHGTKIRYVRENLKPFITGERNPTHKSKSIQLSLF